VLGDLYNHTDITSTGLYEIKFIKLVKVLCQYTSGPLSHSAKTSAAFQRSIIHQKLAIKKLGNFCLDTACFPPLLV